MLDGLIVVKYNNVVVVTRFGLISKLKLVTEIELETSVFRILRMKQYLSGPQYLFYFSLFVAKTIKQWLINFIDN